MGKDKGQMLGCIEGFIKWAWEYERKTVIFLELLVYSFIILCIVIMFRIGAGI